MRVVLQDLVKRFANSDRAAVNKINLVINEGELAVLARSIGLRQDDDPAHDRRLGTAG